MTYKFALKRLSVAHANQIPFSFSFSVPGLRWWLNVLQKSIFTTKIKFPVQIYALFSRMSADLMKGIDFNCPPVLTIRHQALASNVEKIVEPVIVNYEQVGSYNWFGTSKKPVIIVPGMPKFFRKWNGGKLKRETGIMMVDENHYMSPDYPMESLFQAAKICLEKDENRRNFKFQDYDIVCDRNIIRKLYSVLGESSERKEKFRINVHRVGRIIVFVRCQACDKEEAPKQCVYQ